MTSHFFATRSGRTVILLGAALIMFGVNRLATAQVIDPTVVDVSSALGSSQCCDRAASHTVDGSGLDPTGTQHTNAAEGAMWTNAGSNAFSPADGSPFITYDLGSSVDVTSAHVWNYNENIGATCCIGFGPKDVQVSAGNDMATLTPRGSVVFPEADGTNTYTGADVPLALSAVRFVRFDIKDTWGNSVFDGTTGVPNGDDPRGLTGLSEIRFNTGNVPEPAFIAAVAVGAVGLLRRRHVR